ncbi:hypothetical protein JMJ94_10555 [Rhodovulum visakhapatnamense]|uniref:Uncharacterized protein n=2 Tax=Rhodovulum visakhapatnamense TaxID=364297 RepID=A0ABS1RFD8_9RHOB|nr:hypothetical protein [Rhodovulum visakhapatnamense]MBL3569935.1 hypothetical protein [Rhodovulum visakhapatnamense]MBL3578372.1 hypothetical protein [Rhodovulum visakhapatnamense]
MIATSAPATADQSNRLECLRQLVDLDFVSFGSPNGPWTNAPYPIDYEIENHIDRAIETVSVNFRLFTQGREVPWIDKDIEQFIPGGVEPHERREIRVLLDAYGVADWPKPFRFELNLIDISDAAGRSFMLDFGQDGPCSAPPSPGLP